MQDAQPARIEVVERVRGRGHVPGGGAGERERDRVDGEVAAQEILLERSGLYVGQRAGVRVGLAPRAPKVIAEAVELDGRGSEAIVGQELAAESLREHGGIPLDNQVQVGRMAPEQQIANGPADQVNSWLIGQALEQWLGGR